MALTMPIKRALRWIVALLLILAAWGYFWLQSPDTGKVDVIACEDIVQGCSYADFKVQTMSQPTTMRAFEMRITLPAAASVHASFDMADMQMGINRYRFQEQPDGSWRAMVTLPLCVSGRSDWLMTLEIKRSAQAMPAHYRLAFTAQH